ncbi:MAG: hypothetical protein V3S41_03730 [Spirochaetia bacterium]
MRVLLALFFVVGVVTAPFAQDAGDTEIRNGFRELRLGMTIEAAKAALGVDPNFAYRGDPDVSLLPSSGLPIIQTGGVAFIDRAILQFTDNQLYVLTLLLNRSRLDYFGLFSEFSSRYGDPDRLDPGQAVWESEQVILSLERPLTVKYVDVLLFAGVVEAGVLEESLENMTRERFLGQL